MKKYNDTQLEKLYNRMNNQDFANLFVLAQEHDLFYDNAIWETEEFLDMMVGDDLLNFVDEVQADGEINFHQDYVLVEGYMDLTTFDFYREVIDFDDFKTMVETVPENELKEIALPIDIVAE